MAATGVGKRQLAVDAQQYYEMAKKAKTMSATVPVAEPEFAEPQTEELTLDQRNEICLAEVAANVKVEACAALASLPRGSLILVQSCGETRTPGEWCFRKLSKLKETCWETTRLTMGSRLITEPIRKMSIETALPVYLVKDMKFVKGVMDKIHTASEAAPPPGNWAPEVVPPYTDVALPGRSAFVPRVVPPTVAPRIVPPLIVQLGCSYTVSTTAGSSSVGSSGAGLQLSVPPPLPLPDHSWGSAAEPGRLNGGAPKTGSQGLPETAPDSSARFEANPLAFVPPTDNDDIEFTDLVDQDFGDDDLIMDRTLDDTISQRRQRKKNNITYDNQFLNIEPNQWQETPVYQLQHEAAIIRMDDLAVTVTANEQNLRRAVRSHESRLDNFDVLVDGLDDSVSDHTNAVRRINTQMHALDPENLRNLGSEVRSFRTQLLNLTVTVALVKEQAIDTFRLLCAGMSSICPRRAPALPLPVVSRRGGSHTVPPLY